LRPVTIAIVFLASLGVATARAQVGSIAAWGWNSDGQCNLPSQNAGFVELAGGVDHSLGLRSDGTIVAWGRND
jgi:alpha-tubulin suppressor-like RCC1 family protein